MMLMILTGVMTMISNVRREIAELPQSADGQIWTGREVCFWEGTEFRYHRIYGLVYIYHMPDGSLRLQCGNCGALLPQLRILAGQRNGKFVPARCPECGSAIVGVQVTEDWSAEDGD